MALTVETLSKQVAPRPNKYMCKLRPFAQELHEKILWNWYDLVLNPNPMAFDFAKNHLSELEFNKKVIGERRMALSQSPSPSAMTYLEENPSSIILYILLENPAITQKLLDIIIDHYPEIMNIHYHHLSCNSSDVAVDHLLQHTDKIVWMRFCENSNPRAVALLKNNLEKINWSYLCSNENDEAIELLWSNKQKLSDINFDILSLNSTPRAFDMLMQFPEYINYSNLASNKNPKAVAWLIRHPEKIDWYRFSANPSAIDYLEMHPDEIIRYIFINNPAIFEYDYQSICKDRSSDMKELLRMISLHPDRIDRLIKQGISQREIVDNL